MSRRLVTNIPTSVFICANGTEANDYKNHWLKRNLKKKNCKLKMELHIFLNISNLSVDFKMSIQVFT